MVVFTMAILEQSQFIGRCNFLPKSMHQTRQVLNMQNIIPLLTMGVGSQARVPITESQPAGALEVASLVAGNTHEIQHIMHVKQNWTLDSMASQVMHVELMHLKLMHLKLMDPLSLCTKTKGCHLRPKVLKQRVLR